jgi:hypothetical protein
MNFILQVEGSIAEGKGQVLFRHQVFEGTKGV